MTALLSWIDLQKRWSHYTRQGLYKVRAWEDFPKPIYVVSDGKSPLWHLPDITAFEKAHPELTSNVEKWRKVTGYQRALAKGNGRGV